MRLQATPSPVAACWLGLASAWRCCSTKAFSRFAPRPSAHRVVDAYPLRCVTVVGGFLVGLIVALLPLILRNLMVGVPPLQLATTGATAWAMGTRPMQTPYSTRLIAIILRTDGSERRAASRHGVAVSAVIPWRQGILVFYLRRATGLIVPTRDLTTQTSTMPRSRIRCCAGCRTMRCSSPSVWWASPCGRKLQRFEPLLTDVADIVRIHDAHPALSRYRVTLAVFLFPFAGAALGQAVRWSQQRRFGPLGAALARFVSCTPRPISYNDVWYLRQRSCLLSVTGPQSSPRRKGLHTAGTPAGGQPRALQLVQVTPSREERTSAWLQAARLQFQAGDISGAQRSLETLAQSSGMTHGRCCRSATPIERSWVTRPGREPSISALAACAPIVSSPPHCVSG